MKELLEYRQKLLQRFEQAAEEFCVACQAVKRAHDPIEPGGWSVHQVAVHTRDVDKLAYGLRARRTLTEDNPEFSNFDGEAYMVQHYDAQEALQLILDGFAANVQALLKQLREMAPEGWSRLSSHETQGGGLTLQTWVERGIEHIEEHLATVKGAAARS